MTQDATESLSNTRIYFDLAWRRTRSLSEAAAEGLKAGASPEEISRLMERDIRFPHRPQNAFDTYISPQAIEMIGRISDPSDRVAALSAVACLNWSSLNIPRLINSERDYTAEIASLKDEKSRNEMAIAVVHMRSCARTLLEQRSFNEVRMNHPIVTSPLVHKMIDAGRKALVEFDQIAEGHTLAEIISTIRPSLKQKTPGAQPKVMAKPSSGPRLVS